MNFFANLVRQRSSRPSAPAPAEPQATPVAQAVAAQVVQAQPVPPNVSLIIGHANYTASTIFKGLLVSKAEDGRLKLDSRYEQVCYLLKLMTEGAGQTDAAQSPDMPSLEHGVTLQPLAFDSRDAYDGFFATMLEGSKGNWAALYAGALKSMGGRTDLIGAALAAEQRQTLEGVDRCVRETGLTLHRVAATATGLVGQPAEGTHADEITQARLEANPAPATDADLICRARITLVRLDAALGESGAGGEGAGAGSVPDERPPMSASTEEISQALGHNGDLSLTIRGALRVYAPTPEVATKVAEQIMRLQAHGSFPYELPFEPQVIQAVTMSARQAEEEHDWDVER